ncbi:MAG: helix-turn-helix transcriptional regulator [Clostridium celatum]|nr:helix-turn-helix transcriptional regulator [Clostridium celatum]MDU4978849.1 helix-turn-helix transcriptional regulator [Clostridium celatum]
MDKLERLRYLRVLYQLNQTQIGKSIGTSRNYISQVENGKLQISKEQYNKLINAIYRIGEAKKKGLLDQALEDIKKELESNKN